ncbi:MAG: hypothetical protein ACLRXT_02420 [Dialister invisus]
MKSLAYSEQKILQSLPGITLITLGKPYFIAKEGMLTDEQRKTWETIFEFILRDILRKTIGK